MPVKGGYIGRQDVTTRRAGRTHRQVEPYKQEERKMKTSEGKKTLAGRTHRKKVR